ncbi:MAG: class I SAM-dependent methyltransferase [Desulfobacterales bacterium]|nr:class I SAM-dependent methyltransferase [Desulfobacterales bacterium]
MSYFLFRKISYDDYKNFQLPKYLEIVLQRRFSKSCRILDYGCGFGQMLNALHKAGFTNLYGVEIDKQAIDHTGKSHLLIDPKSPEWNRAFLNHFELIILSHVLEHIPKKKIISFLENIKNHLKPGGSLIIMVPNAQSNTGCYWAFEDFTHEYLFTSGSLYYVLRAAGFTSIEFLDPDCTVGLPTIRKFLKQALLLIYKSKLFFWNQASSSSYHKPSPQIFSYEIKAIAS